MAKKRTQWIALGAIALMLVLFFVKQAVTARSLDATRMNEQVPTFETRQGPLLISLTVSGTVMPRDQVILRNEVEGDTRILTIVDEGIDVKEGDVLVELDHSMLMDLKVEEEIVVKTTEAAYVSAREGLEVIRSQGQSDIAAAKLALEFAQLDLSKFLDGDYPMQLKDVDTRIALAEGQAKRAQDQLEGSQRLAAKKFITQTELEADQLDALQTKLELQLVKDERSLLEDFTRKRQVDQLESDVHQAEMALERITRSARADEVRAEADLAAAEAEYLHAKTLLAKLSDQIEKATIRAPRDGLVVYASTARSGGFRREAPLEEGQQVRERQELIYLPTAAAFRIDAKVQEASRARVEPGLPVRVLVEGLPSREFYGRVDSVGILPDTSASFMNPDLRVYNMSILLEGDTEGLRTGMTCSVQIIINNLTNVTYVPLRAVVRLNGQDSVYVVEKGKLTPRPVKLGEDNGENVVIESGLDKGELVSIVPSLENTERGPDGGKGGEFLRQMERDKAAAAAG